jgi:hypothetical protein
VRNKARLVAQGFLVWASKVSRLRFLVAPQNQREDEDGAGHASRSSVLLRLDASHDRVF